eukprot:CAMPEP_0201285636 /NCGR_PEP_ID=MMETSP1317-20130820/113608_1 /ASSEMBLY_ACC=CAM_ASM_000770 /TAXON_ID=187299 /ORGANISM="Undescribed Undescribed, Strain Undescribed" /LENGTH=146 /DNA_ID=CAMNT_0047611303 /DNA_START=130 /DNA_END=570 /DNA_ORIENTATION=+
MEGEVSDRMIKHYLDRADCGLILSEALWIDETGNCFPFSPGMKYQTHIDGWKKINAAVHAKGAKILAQIYHSGRALKAETKVSPDNIVYGPSATAAFAKPGSPQYETPKECTVEDINWLVESFKTAARNCQQADFPKSALLKISIG